jgi:hypothetical protein
MSRLTSGPAKSSRRSPPVGFGMTRTAARRQEQLTPPRSTERSSRRQVRSVCLLDSPENEADHDCSFLRTPELLELSRHGQRRKLDLFIEVTRKVWS